MRGKNVKITHGLDKSLAEIGLKNLSVLAAHFLFVSAHLYGLDRDELRYILDPTELHGADFPSATFRVLKNNEIKQFGEYRTQKLVLEAWNKISSKSTR